MHKKTIIVVLGAVGILLGTQLTALADDASDFSMGTGFDYSSGTYGTSTTTDITSIPVYGMYTIDRWTLKLTVPYIRISGSTNVIPGFGKLGNSNPNKRGNQANSTTSTTAQGLGDIVAAASYNAYYDEASALGVDLTGKIKFGTADANQGLGTGENDYSGEVDVYKSYGKITAFGGIGYNLLGSSQYIQLNNVFNVTLGGSYKIDERNTASLSYNAEQQVSDTGYPQRTLVANLVHNINKQWNAQAYALAGFSYGSPDWGTGASVAYSF